MKKTVMDAGHIVRITLFILLTFPLVGYGQLHFSSIGEIWKYADENSTTLKLQDLTRSSANLDRKKSYAGIMPAVSANGLFTDNITIQSTLIPSSLFNPGAPADSYTEARFGRRYIYNANISAQMELLNAQTWFGIKAAKINEEIVAASGASIRKDLYTQLATAYFTCLLLQEIERNSKENLKTAGEIYSQALEKYSDGLISEIPLNTALINKEKAGKMLENAGLNYSIQMNNLQLLLNTEDSIELQTDPSAGNPLIADRHFPEDPEVRKAQLQMMLSQNQWRSSKAAFLPTLSAVYQYGSQVAGDNFLSFGNSNTVSQQYWGLRLSMPIFSGRTRKIQVQKSKIEYQRMQDQYRYTQQQVNTENTNRTLSYFAARHSWEKSSSILELYRRNDLHASARLKEGVISLDERLKAYSDLLGGEQEYFQSLSDYYIQQYTLQLSQTDFKQ